MSVRGVSSSASIAGPLLATRRSTALASLSKRRANRSRRQCSTARLMAACGGVPSSRSWAEATCRIKRARCASVGNGFSRNLPRTASSVPNRRNTVVANSLAKALSRGSKWAGSVSFRASSSVVPLPTTLSISATANRRAGSPDKCAGAARGFGTSPVRSIGRFRFGWSLRGGSRGKPQPQGPRVPDDCG